MSVYGLPAFSFDFHGDIFALETNQGLIQLRHALDYSLNALSGRKGGTCCKSVYSHDDALGLKLKGASYIRGGKFYGVFQQNVLNRCEMRVDRRAWSLQKGDRVELFIEREKYIGEVTKVVEPYKTFEVKFDEGRRFSMFRRDQLRREDKSKRK